jgi:hypothetical protein
MAGSRALLVTLAIAAGGAVLGVAGGLAWSAIAPRAVFSVQSPGVAYVVNPETNAFIAADGWFALIGLIGGAIIGITGYLTGVRRYGPVPAAGALAGATAAAFLASWTGSHVGLDGFRHRLATSKPGTLLRQPADLGAHGALVFWPLAAGVVIGGIELVLALRERQRRARPEYAGPPGRHRTGPAGPGSADGSPQRRDLDGLAPRPRPRPRPGVDGYAAPPGLDGYAPRPGLDGHAPYPGVNGDAQQPGLDGRPPPRHLDGEPGWRQADWPSDQYDR